MKPVAPSPGTGGQVIEVAAGLVFRDNKLLITRRLPNEHLGGLWEFPGGKREPNESFEECLIRELNEELGIRVIVRDLMESLTHDYPQKSVHIRFYCCDLIEGEPVAIGCQDFRWVGPEELGLYAFPEADQRLLTTLRSIPGVWGF